MDVNDVNTIAGNSNNIFANPQFIGVNDFHLGTYSPCIDTGLNTARAIPSTDKDGNPRIYNNHIVDMGAYEFQGTSTPPPGTPTTLNVFCPATITTSATFTMIITLLDSDGNIYEGTTTVTMLNTTNSITPSTITLAGTTTATCTITISPNGGTDTITISYGAIKTSSQVIVFVNSKTGGTVTSNEVTIVIGTLTANAVVYIATSTQKPTNLPANIFFGGIACNIELRDEQGNQTGTQAGQIGTVAIYFSYNDADNNGIVDGTNIKEENLRIYHFDNGIWTPLATTVMVAENIVWAYIPHFSEFILAGPVFSPDLIKVFAYPNPCRIYGGNRQITFKGLTTQANIKIFNIVGELVKEIEHTNGTDEEVWIDSGSVASGIYIYLITNDKGEKAIGKLGIIK